MKQHVAYTDTPRNVKIRSLDCPDTFFPIASSHCLEVPRHIVPTSPALPPNCPCISLWLPLHFPRTALAFPFGFPCVFPELSLHFSLSSPALPPKIPRCFPRDATAASRKCGSLFPSCPTCFPEVPRRPAAAAAGDKTLVLRNLFAAPLPTYGKKR